MYQGGSKLPDEFADLRGFTYKLKRISIGSNQLPAPLFGKTGSGTLYDWYTGEIHILDNGIRPNTARNAFEPSEALTNMEGLLGPNLKKRQLAADTFRKVFNAEQAIEADKTRLSSIMKGYEGHVAATPPKEGSDGWDAQSVHSQLGDIIKDLDSKGKLLKGKEADISQLLQVAKELRAKVWQGRQRPDPAQASKSTSKAASTAPPNRGIS